MSSLIKYPVYSRKGQSFKKVKRVTVPKQSMGLEEILKRFVRREELPIEKRGFYADNLGDLEKLSHADIVVQRERAADLRKKMAGVKSRQEKRIMEEEAIRAEGIAARAAAEGAQGAK